MWYIIKTVNSKGTHFEIQMNTRKGIFILDHNALQCSGYVYQTKDKKDAIIELARMRRQAR